MAETYIVKITEQAQEQMQEIAHYIYLHTESSGCCLAFAGHLLYFYEICHTGRFKILFK